MVATSLASSNHPKTAMVRPTNLPKLLTHIGFKYLRLAFVNVGGRKGNSISSLQ